jgi:5-methylcytosine-specific restriction endonuclease McrA
MIYTYKPMPYIIEGFDVEISYFFESLFTANLKAYDENILLRANFIPIVNASAGRLKGNLEKITASYHSLTAKDKNTIKKAFKNNRNIGPVCDDNRKHLIKYEALEDKKFLILLKDFLTMLWEEYPQNNLVEGAYGTVQSHFNAFINPTHQKAFVCPFCGLLSLKPKGVYRNAYDHFIPKSLYPFVSINYKNLFPICHDCNSDEKKATDTLYNIIGPRRRAFYPSDLTYNKDHLSITICTNENYGAQNFKTLLKNINWDYALKYAGKTDPRLVTWDEVFNIKRRYREHIVQYETTWFEDILLKKYKEDMQDGLTFSRFKEKILDESKSQIQYPLGMLRFVYFNFLFSLINLEAQLKALT